MPNESPRLWHASMHPTAGQPDPRGAGLARDAAELGLPGPLRIAARRGFLIETDHPDQLVTAVDRALLDPVIERAEVVPCAPDAVGPSLPRLATIVHVLRLPGVTDPEGESAAQALRAAGCPTTAARAVWTYVVEGPETVRDELIRRVLCNDAVECAVVGPIAWQQLAHGGESEFHLVVVPLLEMDDERLLETSRRYSLALSLEEMRTIQAHFRDQGRNPTDAELETLAQTWSEHCSHKTLRGVIDFEGETIDNLLKRTIFEATRALDPDWVVSVFKDNAGVVRFDEDYDVCFKVETHNHPSAIDPYGGANTGIGGVIRDPMGTGLGAKPIANTDVFCVGPPDYPPERLPQNVLHPKRVLRGVVAGVRDYGNRMGIPTVNGAVCVDPGYLCNPLVFCGTVGLLPRGMSEKSVAPDDLIVAVGGRTGRDGIHGATFSSIELSDQTAELSGGAVQIGDAIVEKKVLDFLMPARDRGLYRAITDCGAGGFSSAVGEMGHPIGATVDLDKAPLKYQGLTYTEIWISEAQERMVLAVPPEHWEELRALADASEVEATVLGTFGNQGRLTLRYRGEVVGDLDMEFLHEGRPRVVRKAVAPRVEFAPVELPEQSDYTPTLRALLGSWDICSKEWIVRQYDHEVQGRTIIKPLVGTRGQGPGDAAVIRPVAGRPAGLAIACGIAPRLGNLDPHAMAGCAIDEAIRNAIAVGADPDRIALLDNFCWGSPERPEALGSLVVAARSCHDHALAYGTPFISGKDSLYNEYEHEGRRRSIPPTLLISAIGRVPDVSGCVTMDLKRAGNALWLVGNTTDDLGGAHVLDAFGLTGGRPPRPEASRALATYRALHRAIRAGWIRSCHDLSEGGLAVALAEMALAGDLGADVSLRDVPCERSAAYDPILLFAETPTRLLVEVTPANERAFMHGMDGSPIGRLGEVTAEAMLSITGLDHDEVIKASLADLRTCFLSPLSW